MTVEPPANQSGPPPVGWVAPPAPPVGQSASPWQSAPSWPPGPPVEQPAPRWHLAPAPPLAPLPDQLGRPGQTTPVEPAFERDDVRAAALVVGVLAVLGVLAGLLWASISSHSLGYVEAPTTAHGGNVVIPNETEQFVSADGRFAIITGFIGLAAGLVCWFWRARRGPVLALALTVGGVVGALVAALVGHVVGGGHSNGTVQSTIRLPITVHAHGLFAVEAGAALVVYLLGTLLSAPDDLGRRGASTGSGGDPDPASVQAAGDHQRA